MTVTILLILRYTIVSSITKLVNIIVEVLILDIIEELLVFIKGYVEIISFKLITTTILRIASIKSIFKVNSVNRGSFFRN